MKKAYSMTDLKKIRRDYIPFRGEWEAALGHPEGKGVWVIWGNSGSGKTSFTLRLCRELSRWMRVAYDSLEEGISDTIVKAAAKAGFSDKDKNFNILDNESLAELNERLAKRKAPDVVVIDSIQYAQMNFSDYKRFKEQHPDKLLIFISHADGRMPSGRCAQGMMYDASMKLYVEGYRMMNKGRYHGLTDIFTIWPERAAVYWGTKDGKEEKDE